MPAWVRQGSGSEWHERAKAWAVANGYSVLEWLIAVAAARHEANGTVAR